MYKKHKHQCLIVWFVLLHLQKYIICSHIVTITVTNENNTVFFSGCIIDTSIRSE